jgi:hypothetical protein
MSEKESTTHSPSDATATGGQTAEVEQLRATVSEREKTIGELRAELAAATASYY